MLTTFPGATLGSTAFVSDGVAEGDTDSETVAEESGVGGSVDTEHPANESAVTMSSAETEESFLRRVELLKLDMFSF